MNGPHGILCPAGRRMATRRGLLKTGAMAAAGALLPAAYATRRPARSCIFLVLVGGPSHLDTWDPKPDAPREIRGPFRAIPTSVAGIRVTEIFPRMAKQAGRYSLLRAVHHDASPVHDAGHQLIQTGRLCAHDEDSPHAGCAVARLLGDRAGMPAHVVLPHPIGATGADLPHGQTAGFLGTGCAPLLLSEGAEGRLRASGCAAPPDLQRLLDVESEARRIRESYGETGFGRSCLRARRLVEAGARFVTVNMFETVFNRVTWDAHGFAPFNSLDAYRDSVAPTFDAAFSALIEDLSSRGLLEETMVVAAGEFGRSPRLNLAGGRDHWPHCWTVLMAGGGLRGGIVVGASDRYGEEPAERPVKPAEIVATLYAGFGIDPRSMLKGPDGTSRPLVDAGIEPIQELLA